MNVTPSSPTVNPKEVTHFSQFASSIWWDKKRALYLMNNARVPWVCDGLIATGIVKQKFIDTSKPLTDIQILDVGCGGGVFTEALAELGCAIVGLDASPELVEIAREHAALNPSLTNLSYILQSVEEHAESNYEQYDAVIASEVVEHVTNVDLFLQVCVKCLKPGGSIFISTFNKTWSSWAVGIIYYEYLSTWIPRGTHDWNKFIAPSDVEKILEKYNCRTQQVCGMNYNLITGKWGLTTSSSIQYGLQAVKNANVHI